MISCFPHDPASGNSYKAAIRALRALTYPNFLQQTHQGTSYRPCPLSMSSVVGTLICPELFCRCLYFQTCFPVSRVILKGVLFLFFDGFLVCILQICLWFCLLLLLTCFPSWILDLIHCLCCLGLVRDPVTRHWF